MPRIGSQAPPDRRSAGRSRILGHVAASTPALARHRGHGRPPRESPSPVCRMAWRATSPTAQQGETTDHGGNGNRARDRRAALERQPVLLPHHARPRLPLRQRPVRDDRAGNGRAPAAARVLDRQRQLGGAPGILLDQGAERPAHLAPAAPAARRPADRHAQTHRHPGADRSQARQASVPARHRHRAGAVHERHPRPGHLRALRPDRAGPRRAPGRGPRLRRLPGKPAAAA